MAAQRSSAAARIAAPQREIPYRPQHPVRLRPVPEKKRSHADRAAHAAAVSRRALRIVLVSAVTVTMLALLIVQRVQIATLDMNIVKAQQQLDEAKSETVRLGSLFNSMASVESVEDYAANHLGMVKRTRNQVSFFVNDNTDEILLLDGVLGQ
ncbi:MAG: hypothetical protein IKW76_08795 [Clostridia bacterium]|nr:hypothetical protein [Clostridia bacterium]